MEQIIELALRVIQAVEGIAALIRTNIVQPFLGDSSYRSGFTWGAVTTLVFGLWLLQMRRWWKDVLRYFRPVDGEPRPFRVYLGCVAALIQMFLTLLLVTILLIAVFRGL